MDQFWREEEGEVAPDRPNPSAAQDLWRPEEGKLDEPLESPQQLEGLWDEQATSETLPGNDAPNQHLERGKAASKSKTRLLRPFGILAAILLVLGLVADLAYSTVSAGFALRNVVTELERTKDALSAGNLEGARRSSSEALEQARRAEALTDHPGFRLAQLFPDGDVLSGVSEASVLAARAAVTGTDAAQEIGVEESGVAASVYSDGRVRLARLEAAQTSIAEASRLLVEARETMDDLPEPLIDALSTELGRAREEVGHVAEVAAKARALTGALPTMLGRESESRYLLAFQATGEARATGGLIGFLGTLRARDGKVTLGNLRPIGEAFPGLFEQPVQAPAWFAESYGPQTALRQVQQVNVSPNFPVVSDILLAMHEELTGKQHSGVIAMDPIALASMMEGMEPIEIGGRSVTSDNVAAILLRESYELDTAEQNRFIEQLVETFWTRVRRGDIDERTFLSGLNEAAETQHFKVYSEDDDVEASMQEIEASGDYQSAGPNVQMVYTNNYSANKVDYFMHRQIETVMALKNDGAAEVRTTVTLDNRAPDGPPSLLLGGQSNDSDPPGTNTTLLSVLLPEGAVVRGTEEGEGGPLAEAAIYEDEEHPVVWDIIEVAAGEIEKFTVVYELGSGTGGESGNFQISFFPQATVNPDRFSLTVHAPAGSTIRREFGRSVEDDSVTVDGTLDAPVTLGFEVLAD